MEKLGSRIGLAVCAALILFWFVKPGGSQFMPVPITHDVAPAWSLAATDGSVVSSTNLAGRVVLMNFWATWCPPCVREIPDLAEFHKAHEAEGLTIVGASVETGDEKTVKSFVERNHIPYPVGIAGPGLVESFAATGSIPTTFVIDRSGRFAARYLGGLTREELDRAVLPLLAATNAPPK